MIEEFLLFIILFLISLIWWVALYRVHRYKTILFEAIQAKNDSETEK